MPMAEYIELIDKYRINFHDSPYSDYDPPSYEWVDNTGEIVRCMDCDCYCFDEGSVSGEKEWMCVLFGRPMKESDYCSKGMRKKEVDVK